MIRLPSTVMTYCNGYTGGYTVVYLYDESLVEELNNSSFRYYNIGNKLIVIRLNSEELNRLGLAGTVKTTEEVNEAFGETLKSVFFFVNSCLSTKSGYCRLNRFVDYENDLCFTRVGPHDIWVDCEMSFSDADEATKTGKTLLGGVGTVTEFGYPSCENAYMACFNRLKNLIL